MAAAKPSKKQRGKNNAVVKAKKATAAVSGESTTTDIPGKIHVKFNDDGEKVTKVAAIQKKRVRTAPGAPVAVAETKREGGGKSDRSPEMIQQAKYYLEQWKSRNEQAPEGELPWKFKVRAACFNASDIPLVVL